MRAWNTMPRPILPPLLHPSISYASPPFPSLFLYTGYLFKMIILRPSFQLWWKECRWMGKSYLSPLVSVTKGGNQRGYLLYLVEQRSLEIFYSLRGVNLFVSLFFFSLSYQESHHSNRGSIQKLRISIQRLFLPAFYILLFSLFFLFFFRHFI